MAWNPNIPAVTNRVQDDLDAIRENFQVLDGHLADTNNPHQVTAAQVGAPTQAAFDAHVADTNNPHNVQAQQVPYSSDVSGFSPADVKTALDALAGVRIVEMGSNNNGTYVRWENGLQVVFGEANVGSISLSATGSVYASPDLTVTLPAVFSTGVYAWHVNSDIGLGTVWAGLGSQAQSQAGSITFRLYGGSALSNPNVRVSFFAIGRWK